MPCAAVDPIRHIHDQWHASVVARDLDGLLALYAEDALLETPLVVALEPDRPDGILRGRRELRPFFESGFRRFRSELGRWYRTGTYFANGRQLVWEYPRATPDGDQLDLVEVMDIAGGLIVRHRVYWGWTGFRALTAALRPPPP